MSTIDENNTPISFGVLDTDGTTQKQLTLNGRRLKISDGTTGSNNGPTIPPHNENGRNALWGVSSVDGITPVVVYVNSSGQLLIKSS